MSEHDVAVRVPKAISANNIFFIVISFNSKVYKRIDQNFSFIPKV